MLRLCTAYFPPLDYFATLAREGEFVVDTQEHYIKQTFRNRCRIVTSQGVQDLSVPCIKTMGNHTPVEKMAIDNAKNWQRGQWRSLCTAYNKSPFFLYYRDDLEIFFEKRYENLSELNTGIIDLLLKKLRLSAQRVDEPAHGNTAGLPDAAFVPPLDFSPKKPVKFTFEPYLQTFPCPSPTGHLSILDLLFNAGPEAASILQNAQPICQNG